MCGAGIRPYGLVPVAGYILLGGKCGSCKARISVRYPLIELACAALGVAAIWLYGVTAAAGVAFLIWALLLAVAVIDAEHMIIPDGLVAALLALALAWAVIGFDGWGFAGLGALNRLAGFAVISVPMFILVLLVDGAFGGGDIKLIAVCGIVLGFRLTLVAAFIAVLLGGGRGIYLKYIKKADVKGVHMPFGPYLCAGVFTAMVCGDTILDWYLGFLG